MQVYLSRIRSILFVLICFEFGQSESLRVTQSRSMPQLSEYYNYLTFKTLTIATMTGIRLAKARLTMPSALILPPTKTQIFVPPTQITESKSIIYLFFTLINDVFSPMSKVFVNGAQNLSRNPVDGQLYPEDQSGLSVLNAGLLLQVD